MRRKEYIEKAKQQILNRVRFHAPIVFNDDIDKEILTLNGVDVSKPIFKFDKNLSKPLAKAFMLAKAEEDFNLLLPEECKGLVKDEAALFFNAQSPLRFLEMINKLNINYSSATNYNLIFKDQFFKVNGKIINPHYDNFSLCDVSMIDDVFVQYSEFVLNGANFYVHFQRKTAQNQPQTQKIQNNKNLSSNAQTCQTEKKKVELELNLPLEKGYYFFKRQNKCVEICNLLTKEIYYLNFLCKNAKFSFSNVDGLENSVYCCVNVKVSISLENEDFVYFNFGKRKSLPKNENEVKMLLNASRRYCCEIFNLQVKTKMPKFDYFFNKTLPQKIWTNWLNGKKGASLEEKYLGYKRMFIRGSKEISFVNFKEIGVKELGIFNGEYYKKILIISGSERFLRVGKTFFYNINGVTNYSLSSKEPITICFGEPN